MKTSKAVIGAACVVVSAGAIAGGLWLRAESAPLAMPASAEEAIAGLKSDAYEEMSGQRRRQYADAAFDTFGELSEEERRALREQFRDDAELQEAMRRAMQDRFDKMIRDAARGKEMERPGWGGGDRRRPDPDELTDEQRERMEAMRERMQERIAQQLRDTWQSGDAQSTGLRQEFFKQRFGGGDR